MFFYRRITYINISTEFLFDCECKYQDYYLIVQILNSMVFLYDVYKENATFVIYISILIFKRQMRFGTIKKH